MAPLARFELHSMAAMVQALHVMGLCPVMATGRNLNVIDLLMNPLLWKMGRPQLQVQVCRVMFEQHVGSCGTPCCWCRAQRPQAGR